MKFTDFLPNALLEQGHWRPLCRFCHWHSSYRYPSRVQAEDWSELHYRKVHEARNRLMI